MDKESLEMLNELVEDMGLVASGPLAKFYDTNTIIDLIEAQAAHIIKLQDRLLNYTDMPVVITRCRA